MINRQITLKSYPDGIPTPDNFGMIETQVPEPGPGQFVVRNLYFSLEAAIRGWLDGRANYLDPIPIGGAIRGPSVGRVVKSNNPDYAEGDIVWGLNHWEDYSLLDNNTILLTKLETRPGVPLSYYVGALGGSGQTAYVGLHDIGHIEEGQTVVVSAAAGATGSMVGQIAKMRGCKVVGIVGGDDKAELITQELGMDHAINYRTTPDIAAAVQALCPEGVDIYFDNVGGKTLDAMLLCMKDFGRIANCGMISDYNNQDNPTPVYNLWKIVEKQLTMKGFLLYSYNDSIPGAMDDLHRWVANGDIKVLENITNGIANSGAAYSSMMEGKTIGKNLVKLDLPEED
ncbi:MAG: NADP-dependent oxidoreductase [Spongiibacteraceae bacterium]